jgi:hypothetical protein
VSQDVENERAAIQNVVQRYLYLFSRQSWEEWIDLWADDGVLEFPFAPPGRRSRYVGKAEYWNPIVSMDANGGRDAWTAAFGSPDTEAS